MNRITGLLAVALALPLTTAAWANTTDPLRGDAAALQADATEAEEEILDVPGYLALRAEQLQEAERGGYGRIARPTMDRLRTAYATMQRLLDGRASALDLSPEQQVELFNAQETISATLAHQSENALICERSRSTGSHIRNTRCFTRAEREIQRQREQDGMRVLHMAPPCGPGYAGELKPECPGR
jgi:hypothetical protein